MAAVVRFLAAAAMLLLTLTGCGPLQHSACYVFGYNVTVHCDPEPVR